MRSSQLDAAKLDVELTTLLREQFEKIFSLFNQVRPGHVYMAGLGLIDLAILRWSRCT
jgi:hypothetical protein